jgi:plasmid stabilization system protein ParE
MANKIVLLKSAIVDLQWMRVYHETYFPEGLASAQTRFEKCFRLSGAFPKMGRVAGKLPRGRFSVPKLPFTIVYQQRDDEIEIIRILDQRSLSYLDDLFGPF